MLSRTGLYSLRAPPGLPLGFHTGAMFLRELPGGLADVWLFPTGSDLTEEGLTPPGDHTPKTCYGSVRTGCQHNLKTHIVSQ